MPIVNKLPEIKTTDPAGLLWGNDILKILLDTYADEINAITVSREPKVPSGDRVEQLKLGGGIYYIGNDGKDLGYPENYLTLINMRRDSFLVLQLVYNSIGVWIRTVNNTTSSLAWTFVGGRPVSTLLTLTGGWQSYGGSYTPFSAIPIGGGQVRLAGLIRNGTANQIGWLPVHLRPKMRQILTVMNDKFQPVRFDIDPDGSMVFNPSQSNPVTTGYMVMDGVSYFLE